MSNKIKDIMVFVIKNIEDKTLASPHYLKRIIYLMDWEHCLEYGVQFTSVNWIKDEDGISIEYMNKIIENSLDVFKINPLQNSLYYLSLLDESINYKFSKEEKYIVDKVWDLVGNKEYTALVGSVFSTFPYKYYSKKCREVDLVKTSKKFKNMV
jgi:hypothetical protein